MIITPDELRALLGAAYHDGIAAEAEKRSMVDTKRGDEERAVAEHIMAQLARAEALTASYERNVRLTRQLIVCAYILAQNPALKRRAAGDLAQLEHAAKRLEAAMKGTP
jgi:hypothetical protein